MSKVEEMRKRIEKNKKHQKNYSAGYEKIRNQILIMAHKHAENFEWRFSEIQENFNYQAI